MEKRGLLNYKNEKTKRKNYRNLWYTKYHKQ